MDQKIFDQLLSIVEETNNRLKETTATNQQLCDRVEYLSQQVESLEQKISLDLYPHVDKYTVAQILNISANTVRTKHRQWIEGVHYITVSPRVVRYNLKLIEDWIKNRGDATAHRRAIEKYQSYVARRVA